MLSARPRGLQITIWGRARCHLAFREDPGGAGREVRLTALADAPSASGFSSQEGKPSRRRRRRRLVLRTFVVAAGSWQGHAPRDFRVRQAQSGLGTM